MTDNDGSSTIFSFDEAKSAAGVADDEPSIKRRSGNLPVAVLKTRNTGFLSRPRGSIIPKGTTLGKQTTLGVEGGENIKVRHSGVLDTNDVKMIGNAVAIARQRVNDAIVDIRNNKGDMTKINAETRNLLVNTMGYDPKDFHAGNRASIQDKLERRQMACRATSWN